MGLTPSGVLKITNPLKPVEKHSKLLNEKRRQAAQWNQKWSAKPTENTSSLPSINNSLSISPIQRSQPWDNSIKGHLLGKRHIVNSESPVRNQRHKIAVDHIAWNKERVSLASKGNRVLNDWGQAYGPSKYKPLEPNQEYSYNLGAGKLISGTQSPNLNLSHNDRNDEALSRIVNKYSPGQGIYSMKPKQPGRVQLPVINGNKGKSYKSKHNYSYLDYWKVK